MNNNNLKTYILGKTSMRNHICLFYLSILRIQRRVMYVERILSPDDRIKRAEEIYYRRKMQGVRVSTSSVNIGGSNKVSLGRKMMIQILISVVIYCGFITLKNYKSVFSENFIGKTKEILNYDVNFVNLYNQCSEYFNSHFNNIIKKEEQKTEDDGVNINDDQSEKNVTENTENEGAKEENSNEQIVENNQNTSELNEGIRWRNRFRS